MKKLMFVTMLLLASILAQSQDAYAAAPNAQKSEIEGFEIFDNCNGKLNNYGGLFRTQQIQNLFTNHTKDFVNFRVYWQSSKHTELKYIAHGSVRTHFRFSTTLKEAGIYYCKFKRKDGVERMMIINATTKDLQIQLLKKI